MHTVEKMPEHHSNRTMATFEFLGIYFPPALVDMLYYYWLRPKLSAVFRGINEKQILTSMRAIVNYICSNVSRDVA